MQFVCKDPNTHDIIMAHGILDQVVWVLLSEKNHTNLINIQTIYFDESVSILNSRFM